MTEPTPVSTAATTRIRLRRATSDEWEEVNPVLREGEPGYDQDKNMLKIGDGETLWNDLEYLTPPDAGIVLTGDATIDAALASHVNATEPHPAYDDGPSLLLLWQNAKI